MTELKAAEAAVAEAAKDVYALHEEEAAQQAVMKERKLAAAGRLAEAEEALANARADARRES